MKNSNYEELFRNLKKQRAKACVVATSRGTPIAWYGLDRKDVNMYSALVATVYGASSVMHREMGHNPPRFVISGSSDSFMLIGGLENDSVLGVMGEGDGKRVSKKLEKIIEEAGGS